MRMAQRRKSVLVVSLTRGAVQCDPALRADATECIQASEVGIRVTVRYFAVESANRGCRAGREEFAHRDGAQLGHLPSIDVKC